MCLPMLWCSPRALMTQVYRALRWLDPLNLKDCMRCGTRSRLAEGKEDCLVLICRSIWLSGKFISSLVGLPRELNLEGELITEVVELHRQLPWFPAFEIEAAEITLSDVKHDQRSIHPQWNSPRSCRYHRQRMVFTGTKGIASFLGSQRKSMHRNHS